MEKIELIKKTIAELLETMGFEGHVVVNDSDENNILVNIKTQQAGFLIGQGGANLDALQHLSRVLVSKKNNETVRFLLDVNSYRQYRIGMLKDLAKNIAKQAKTEGVAVTLQPMPAYERRIIHLALIDEPRINTESIGQDQERRIVVKAIK